MINISVLFIYLKHLKSKPNLPQTEPKLPHLVYFSNLLKIYFLKFIYAIFKYENLHSASQVVYLNRLIFFNALKTEIN